MTEGSEFRMGLEKPGEQVVIIALEGAVDIYSASEFKLVLLRSLAHGTRRVLVDLTKTTMIDSTGLGVLVSGAKQAGYGALAIICSDPGMRRVFEIIGFQRVAAMYTTRAEALGALATLVAPVRRPERKAQARPRSSL